MASGSGQKIRLVKCPKCYKILQEDEDVPVYQCGGCSTILQAKKRNIAQDSTPNTEETKEAQASEPETNNVSTSSGKDMVLPSSNQDSEKSKNAFMESIEKELGESIETKMAQANESETNNVSTSSEKDMVLPSSNQEYEKSKNASIESIEKKTDEPNEIQQVRETEVAQANESETNNVSTSSGKETILPSFPGHVSLDQDYEKSRNASMESIEKELSALELPKEDEIQEQDESNVTKPTGFETSSESLNVVDQIVAARESNSSSNLDISPDTSSPLQEEEKQRQTDYDGSKSSSEEREDQFLDETEQWKAFQNIKSSKFEQGASSSYSKWHQKKGLDKRRHKTEQLRPLYPRDPYGSSSYQSNDEFDRYPRAHSLQMPLYNRGGMNREFVDYNIRGARGGRRNNHPSFYSGQIHNNTYSSYSASPQRSEYYYHHPRWSHEIVLSDLDDHPRNRHAHEVVQASRAKRHVRPIANAAPFVSCYNCSESLQLPVDFLIFKRKYHLLRCGTCNTVLRFSLQSNTHLVPELTLDINASNSTTELVSSSLVQEEEIHVARGSPLHRLMGYSTLSQVFKGSQRPPSL